MAFGGDDVEGAVAVVAGLAEGGAAVEQVLGEVEAMVDDGGVEGGAAAGMDAGGEDDEDGGGVDGDAAVEEEVDGGEGFVGGVVEEVAAENGALVEVDGVGVLVEEGGEGAGIGEGFEDGGALGPVEGVELDVGEVVEGVEGGVSQEGVAEEVVFLVAAEADEGGGLVGGEGEHGGSGEVGSEK